MYPDAVNRTRIALFVFFQALYALTSSGNAFRIPDEFEVYFQTEHLIDAGDLSVPQATDIRQPVVVDGKVVRTDSVFFGKVGLDGKPYAPYGPLAAVLAVPHHLVGRGLASMMGMARGPRGQVSAWVIFVGGITMLATATAAALTVAGFHRAVIGLGTSAPIALILSLLLGGATVLWPYGTSLFSEAFLTAFFVWAAALLIEARSAERPVPRIVIAAALIALAGLTKVTSLVVAPAFVAAVLAERSLTSARRWQIASIVGGAIAMSAGLQLGWNVYRFGSPFEFGYDWSETIPVMPARAFAIDELPRGLAVLLFAPGKSLFVWAPMLVLSLLNAGDTWRRDRALGIGLLSAAALGLLFFSAYMFPEGGYAHGPRHLVPIIPLLALAAAGPATRAQSEPFLYACGAVGLFIALMATSVSYLEDQALRRDPTGAPVPGYYEIIDPSPGRPNNQYRMEHIPFETAMGSPGWFSSTRLGQGPSYFFLYLRQARGALRDGQAIPAALLWIWPLMWGLLTVAAGAVLWRHYDAMVPREEQAPSGPTENPVVDRAPGSADPRG
jgi:hypothetical protein